ncbi:MAG: tetratricopeptide repeat protein [Ktedonobacteraceae bacterium]|nr:tetratricopeptide repeat protein [Ktedonobacteraceae bacterium]
MEVSMLKQRYQILTMVGQGGFGAIYQAADTHFPNLPKRAVKEMLMPSADPQEQQQAIEAFKQEALLLAGLMHQNLPRIYEYFEEGGRWYLVMDFIEGQTLEDCMEASVGNRLPFQRVLHFATQLCTVLDYLHSQQPPIIFRDLKPANVMVTSDDHLYLIDFGIARLFKPGQAKDTIAFGSPGYAAPEQYGKAQTTERADIYSLGATLHSLLSGLDPSDNPFHFSPLNLSQEAPAGPAFAKLIEQMLEINAQKRPSSVQVIKQQLQQLAQQPAKQAAASAPVTNISITNVPAPPPVQYEKSAPTTNVPPPVQYTVTPDPLPVTVSSSRSNVNDYINESKALIEMGRYQEALAVCERAIRLNPSSALIYINKAAALCGLERYQEALQVCNQALLYDPQNALAHYNASEALVNLERYQEALRACDQALRFDPSHSLAYINKSKALIELERYQEALATCEQATRLASPSASIYVNKAAALNQLGRYQEALPACNQALQYDPQNALAHYNASNALCELGRFQEALGACEQAIRFNPGYSSSYINKSWALIELERYQEALRACNQALEYNPRAAMAHHNASVALIRLGRYQEALQACEQALQLDPNSAKAQINKKFLLKKLRGY